MPRAINGLKVCPSCRIEKPTEQFSVARARPDGRQSHCKQCNIVRYQANRDRILAQRANHLQLNLEEISAKRKKYEEDRREKKAAYNAEYQRKRLQNDPLFRFQHNVRALVHCAFTYYGFRKDSKTVEVLGMSFEDFRHYIKTMFKPGWTFENQRTLWDLDHIVPMSTAQTEEDVIRLNHYTNFQPLECRVNRYVKRGKTNWTIKPDNKS